MPDHVIALAYSAGLRGAGYLLAQLLRPKRKLRDMQDQLHQEAPPEAEAMPQAHGITKANSESETGAPETLIAGSELRYYKPFAPADGVFDVWSKLQTFTSSQPIVVRLSPSDHAAPLLQSAFLPDGTPHGSREMFFGELKNSICQAGPTAWRAVRRLSAFGIPAYAPEASYHFFTGTLRMELKGVQVMGLPFTISATFQPNLGLIPKFLAQWTDYLHCEMPAGGVPAKERNSSELVLVGFPWSLTGITLYSHDQSLAEHASRITTAIVDKYARYVRQDNVVPRPGDPTHRVSVISDEVVAIDIHEGPSKAGPAPGRYLEIEYHPFPHGPLDELAAGDAEFLAFAKALAELKREDLLADQVAALDTPF